MLLDESSKACSNFASVSLGDCSFARSTGLRAQYERGLIRSLADGVKGLHPPHKAALAGTQVARRIIA